jgi:hypothetical protein
VSSPRYIPSYHSNVEIPLFSHSFHTPIGYINPSNTLTSTDQREEVAASSLETRVYQKSRVTLKKVEKAKLFEWFTAHEVGRTTRRARMQAVNEVVASARFHLVMDREKDKYFSIGTEYRTTVMQSLTSGNVENLLKNVFKTYIVGMQLQKDENGN